MLKILGGVTRLGRKGLTKAIGWGAVGKNGAKAAGGGAGIALAKKLKDRK